MKVDIYKTNKKYNIIYADPPWQYRSKECLAKKSILNGKLNYHYNTMTLEELKKLPVNKICEKDCLLFLWVVSPMLDDCIDVLKSWGFKYKTCAFTWIKQNKKSDSLFWGMGSWTRANAELCLIATKGKPKRQSAKVHSVIMSKIREHSRKPDETRDRIVELCGDIPRIELFARQSVDGWDCWGNEV